MSDDRLSQIETLIQKGDVETARNVLREMIQASPTADVYYQAAQAAMNDAQKRIFLQKALELDPFHVRASESLERLSTPAAAQATAPSAKSAVSAIPAIKLPGNIRPRQMIVGAVLLIIAVLGIQFLSNLNTENTVRAESIKALEAKIIAMNDDISRTWGKVGDEDFRIISVQHSTEKQDILGSDSELWCVTFMPPITNIAAYGVSRDYFQIKNALVMRTGLTWEVDGIGPTRSDFLAKGCSNWLEEGDISDNK